MDRLLELCVRTVVALGALTAVGYYCIGFAQLGADNWTLLIALAFAAALYDALYWVSHLFLFIKADPAIL